MTTKAAPDLTGIDVKKDCSARKPPAEAPIATITGSWSGAVKRSGSLSINVGPCRRSISSRQYFAHKHPGSCGNSMHKQTLPRDGKPRHPGDRGLSGWG